MRNYLMVNICIVNCLRASNLMNMVVHDFREAKRDNGITISEMYHDKSWYHDIRNVLKLSKDLDLTDKGLEGLTQEFSNELTVTEGDQHISNDKEAPEVLPRISVETSTERLNTLLEDNQHFSAETSAETVSGLKSVNDSNIPQKILADFGNLSPPNKSLSKEEQHEEPEDDNDHTITITTTKEEVIKFIKNNLGQIKKFLTTEENKYLTKETSLPNGHWVHC